MLDPKTAIEQARQLDGLLNANIGMMIGIPELKPWSYPKIAGQVLKVLKYHEIENTPNLDSIKTVLKEERAKYWKK